MWPTTAGPQWMPMPMRSGAGSSVRRSSLSLAIARINAADSSVGEDLLLPAIAAVCLGGTSLFGGVGGIMGTAVGSLILALIVNGTNLLGVQTFWQNAVMGTIILISVLVDQLGGTRLVRDQ